MSMYGIPEKLITLVKAMYSIFECAVFEEGKPTEWFGVQSGVSKVALFWAFFSCYQLNGS